MQAPQLDWHMHLIGDPRVKTAEHDNAFCALGIDHTVQRGHSHRSLPWGRCSPPCQAGIVATFVDDGSANVSLGIYGENGPVVLK